MIELKPSGKNEVLFTLDIYGDINQIDEIRFTINCEKMKVSFPGKVDGNRVSIEIDNIGKIIPSGEYEYSLEIIVENQFFKPLIDKVNVKNEIKISTVEPVIKSDLVKFKIDEIKTKKEEVEIKQKEKKKPIWERHKQESSG